MTPEEVLQRHLLLVDSRDQVPVTPSPARQDTATSSSEVTPVIRHGNGEEAVTPKERRKLSVREIVCRSHEYGVLCRLTCNTLKLTGA